MGAEGRGGGVGGGGGGGLPGVEVEQQQILAHPEALPDAQVVEQRSLLQLHRQVDDGHVRVVERVQHVGLAKVQLFELQTDGGSAG